MASYINKGNAAFASSLRSEYIDKTGLIAVINDTLFTRNRFTCVSRCRRFGKSMAAEMLCAYYDKSCDSRELFRGLEIECNPNFETHLNKYPVIYVDMTKFVTKYHGEKTIVEIIQRTLISDLSEVYIDVPVKQTDDLMDYLVRIAQQKGEPFVLIIDEWDAICREFEKDTRAMDTYVNLLRRMFKSSDAADVFAGVYLTGILPIKKYKTESALNNFWEYSMIDPEPLSKFYGFTREEVRALCDKYGMPYEELEKWYDGYRIGTEPSMFNPSSVIKALAKKRCSNYWAKTGAFDAVARYIQMNYEGLQDDIVRMLAGGRCKVDTTSFGNDPAIIRDREEVLTVLIHLGYLAYDGDTNECFVPNMEVADEMRNAVKANGWHMVMDTLNASERLLDDLLYGDNDAVAEAIGSAHDRNASILKYNDENSLACVLGLAFYSARNKYKILRELPTGRGFADMVLIPWRNVNLPAIVVELKWKQSAQTALDQIRSRHYPDSLKDYNGEILLCGINYDKDTKLHTCLIERL
ncbi:MAG: AAA family ATPase [Bacteroidaceae bacterium]|nr:AAA family ATPase [Bacteroidaceae bacterium]